MIASDRQADSFYNKPDRLKAVVYSTVLLVFCLLFMWKAVLAPPGYVVDGQDLVNGYYGLLETSRDMLWQGQLPLWNTAVYSGYPALSNPELTTFYPLTWLAFLLPVNVGLNWQIILHVWFAGVGMLFFTQRSTRSWEGAFLSALIFAFSGFTAVRIWAGHITVIGTFAWLPWLLLAALWSIQRGTVWSALIAGVPLGLAFLAGHTSSLLYVSMIWLLYAGFHLITSRGKRQVMVRQTFLTGLSGVLVCGVQLLPAIQLIALSTRANYAWGAAFWGSATLDQLITLVIPEFLGSPLRGDYRGTFQYQELIHYTGVLSVLSAMLSWRKKNMHIWFYYVLIVLGCWLALGVYGGLYSLLYTIFPLVRFARIPARALIMTALALSALTGEVVATYQREQNPDQQERFAARLSKITNLSIAAAIAVVLSTLAFVFLIQPGKLPLSWLILNLWGWIRAFVLFVAAAILLRLFIISSRSLSHRRSLPFAGLVLLCLLDLWGFGYKWINIIPARPRDTIWAEARAFIAEPAARVYLRHNFPEIAANWAGQQDFQNASGHIMLGVGSYNDLVLVANDDPASPVFDTLATSYVITHESLDEFAPALTLIGQSEETWIYQRARSIPPVRLIVDFEVIGDTQQAYDLIAAGAFDPARQVILAEQPPCQPGPEQAGGSLEIVSAQSGYWLINTMTNSPALLVISETMYPGWTVTVDDQPAQALLADTTFKAVCVPAGRHKVEWHYDPVLYKIGAAITLIWLGIVAYSLFKELKQSPAQPIQPAQ